MKALTLNIIKKNRVYFACKTESGFDVKLRIDDNSRELTLGKHDLLVNDVSVRTKYGTDVIYELHGSQKEQKEAGIVTLSHHTYNCFLVEKCRNLGGRWDADAKTWVFSAVVADEVEALDEKYNTDISDYKLTFKKDDYYTCQSYTIKGYTIAIATGRDSGARLNDNIILLKGGFSSGGSMKNWSTTVKEGTQIIMKLSKFLAEKLDQELFVVEKV